LADTFDINYGCDNDSLQKLIRGIIAISDRNLRYPGFPRITDHSHLGLTNPRNPQIQAQYTLQTHIHSHIAYMHSNTIL